MSPRQVVEAWIAAFTRADIEGLAAMYAEDAINHLVANEPVIGRDAIRAMFAREFAGAAMVCVTENLLAFQRGYWDKLSFRRQQGPGPS